MDKPLLLLIEFIRLSRWLLKKQLEADPSDNERRIQSQNIIFIQALATTALRIVLAPSYPGLGHIRRSVLLGRSLSHRAEISFVGDNFTETMISDYTGSVCHVIRDPVRGKFSPEFSHDLIDTLNAIKPDLVIADDEPRVPIISRVCGFRCVYVTSDPLFYLDTPSIALQSSSVILVPDYPSEMRVPASLSRRVTFTGPWLSSNHRLQRAGCRARLKLPKDRKVVLVTLGGSQYGLQLLPTVSKALAILRETTRVFEIIVGGPYYKVGNTNESSLHLSTVSNLHEYIAASDVVITLAGFNTLMEIAFQRVPSIIMPIADTNAPLDTVFEQFWIARRFAKYNAGLVLSPVQLTPSRLRKAIEGFLSEGNASIISSNCRRIVSSNGIGKACKEVYALLTS